MLSDMEFVNKISIPKELPFWLIPCKMGKQNVKIPYLGNLVLRSSNLRKLTFSPKISAPEYMQKLRESNEKFFKILARYIQRYRKTG